MDSLEKFRPGLKKALAIAGNTHTIADVAQLLLDSRAQLWVDEDAIVVTEILQYPRKKVLRIWITTGELEPCLKLIRRVLKWGKEEDCDFAVGTGRRGWLKPLRREGWTETLAVYEQEL